MDYKYINSIPKPLLDDLLKNRVVPIVGAGFSKNADIPQGITMPDWNELGKLVADEISDYEYDNNAIDTLSYYEDLYSRPKLVELLMRELHHGEILPGKTYKAFCDLFRGTICTTNFDSLLEDSMVHAHLPVSVIATEDRLTVGGNNECKILKVHGDFNHPEKMVITEHDYDVYIERNPVMATYIANLFISNTMLLIGYSLDDNDYRGIWQVVHSRLGKMSQPAYCITVGVSEEKRARYLRRNIRVVNLEGDPKDYKEILYSLFTELKYYRDQENDKKAASTNERVNEQLLIPAEDNRLCFISCASTRTARLSAMLFPILNNVGVMPVRFDNMIMPGDNWIDVVETTIRKSKAAIIDIPDSNPCVALELGIITSTSPSKECLLICEDGSNPPLYLSNRQIAFYPSNTMEINEKQYNRFENQIVRWCKRVFGDVLLESKKAKYEEFFADANRLYKKSEYSSCIISACSELEFLINKRHNDQFRRNDLTLNRILSAIRNLPKESGYTEDTFAELRTTRNKIVHGAYSATEEEAKRLLAFIKEINKQDIKDINNNKTTNN